MLHHLTGFRGLESRGLCKISEIPTEECVRVIDNFALRMQACLQRRRGYLKHILERTRLLCEGTSITEPLGNDCTQTEV